MYHIRIQRHQMYLALDQSTLSQITGHVKVDFLKSSQYFPRRYKRIYFSNGTLNALTRYSPTVYIDIDFIAE
jgi:hypothetical protein